MNPLVYLNPVVDQQPTQPEVKVDTSGFNLNYFKDKNLSVKIPTDNNEPAEVGKKRGRPRKEDVPTAYIKADGGSLSMAQSNEPYNKSYDETTAMLRGTIAQIDILSADIKQELDAIKASKTLKNKYGYISDMSSTSSSLISTKISAIKEISNNITTCHKLELQRIKDLKMDASKEKDDDKYIMDLYSAYINTPIGTSFNPISLGANKVMIPTDASDNIIRTDVVPNAMDTSAYNSYIHASSPEQNRMIMESNPNIETVVVYDQSNPNNRYFDVIDKSTGASVPNYPRPDPMFLQDTTINPRAGIARNSNLDKTWKLILIGEPDDFDNF